MALSVAVIGGGLGGLSAAIHLAHRGARVLLFEKESKLGGKAQEVRLNGYRFDTGPSVVTLPQVIEGLFREVGVDPLGYLQLVPVEPITSYFFPDGRRLVVWRDPDRMQAELQAWGTEAVWRWQRFLDYSRRLYENAAPLFLEVPIHEIRLLLRSPAFWRWRNLLLPIDPFRSMHRAARAILKEPHLVQVADRYATYNGSDPFRAPATLNLIFWVEHGLGVFYVKGGVYRLVEALGQLASQKGVEIRLDTPVHRIVVEKGQVVGVETQAGFFPAEVVVSGVDVRTTYRQLLGRNEPWGVRWGEPSLSGLVFLWGLRSQTPLGHHSVFFSPDYEQEFRALFRLRRPPTQPTLYVAITARCDPDHAPAEGENWFVLVNLPAWAGEWPGEETDRLRAYACQVFRREVPGFSEERIEVEQVLTPAHWAGLGSTLGSLYGTASNHLWSAFLRPPNRSRQIRGLYFVGGSSHPGGGIPLVLLSGRHTANLITEAYLLRKNV